MSNVSSINPVAAIAGGLAVACVVAPVLGTVALAKWLSAETEEEKDMLAAVRDKRRRGGPEADSQALKALGTALKVPESAIFGTLPASFEKHRWNEGAIRSGLQPPPSPVITARLHVRNMDNLLQSAIKLGYRPEPLLVASKPLAEQSQVLLAKPSGERLALQRTQTGHIAMSTVGQPERLHHLMRQHILDLVVDHLSSRMGMEVKLDRLGNGEVQVLGREQTGAKRGGPAVVRTRVQADGSLAVDVDQVKGNRCEEIVAGLAGAVGGRISGMRKKDSYWQLPGESTHTEVKV
jgi:hypothetical protein